MREMGTREIQLRELNLLIQFANFCDTHGLRYSLCSGTLLGAVRHKGFIPWDDDIDVQMPRPDYEKMVEINNKENALHIAGLGISTKACVLDAPFLRIQDPGTLVEWKYSRYPTNNQLWIDILPLDGVPDDPNVLHHMLMKKNRLKFCFGRASAILGKGRTTVKGLVKIPVLLILKVIGRDRFARAWTRMNKTYPFESSKEVGVFGGNCYDERETIPREEWCNRIQMEFEGHMFWCMSCWDEHLKRLYGDYMQLPPEDKRQGHHEYTAYVLENK